MSHQQEIALLGRIGALIPKLVMGAATMTDKADYQMLVHRRTMAMRHSPGRRQLQARLCAMR